ncbi:hypothetical protein GQ600_1478 [Phytophthora cactorum]|nr:hypothetical protein GQ600_1478 [Phytophthora cactorum]
MHSVNGPVYSTLSPRALAPEVVSLSPVPLRLSPAFLLALLLAATRRRRHSSSRSRRLLLGLLRLLLEPHLTGLQLRNQFGHLDHERLAVRDIRVLRRAVVAHKTHADTTRQSQSRGYFLAGSSTCGSLKYVQTSDISSAMGPRTRSAWGYDGLLHRLLVVDVVGVEGHKARRGGPLCQSIDVDDLGPHGLHGRHHTGHSFHTGHPPIPGIPGIPPIPGIPHPSMPGIRMPPCPASSPSSGTYPAFRPPPPNIP